MRGIGLRSSGGRFAKFDTSVASIQAALAAYQTITAHDDAAVASLQASIDTNSSSLNALSVDLAAL